MSVTRRSVLSSRRTVLQLTPLLDLLLIVIFAQYLDVGERDRTREEQVKLAAAGEAAAVAEARDATAARDAATLRAAEAEEAVAIAERQAETLLRATSEIFRLPADDRQALLDPETGLLADRPTDEARAASQRLASLMAGDPQAVKRHLQTHEEIRKHADVWRVHLDGGGRLRLIANGREETLAALASLDQFVPSVYDWSKRQPETKSLLLVLFSYDPLARLRQVRGIRSRLPELRDALRADTASRVDYADIGSQRQP